MFGTGIRFALEIVSIHI